MSKNEWKTVRKHLGLKKNEKNAKIFSKIEADNITPALKGISNAIKNLEQMRRMIGTSVANRQIDPILKSLKMNLDRIEKLILSPNGVFIVDEWRIYQPIK